MILSAYGIVFQFALSINIGSNIRVGTLLGAGDSEGARKAAWCGVRLGLMAAVAAALGYWLGRTQWPLLYGVSEDVLGMIVDLTPIYVAGQVRQKKREGWGQRERETIMKIHRLFLLYKWDIKQCRVSTCLSVYSERENTRYTVIHRETSTYFEFPWDANRDHVLPRLLS